MKKIRASSQNKSGKMHESLAILLIAIAVFIFLSLYSYDKMDLSFYTTKPNPTPNNFIGLLGAWIGFVTINGFGAAAFLLPAIVLLWGIKSFFRHGWQHFGLKIACSVVFFLAATLLLQIQTVVIMAQLQINLGIQNIGLGGILGKITCDHLLLRFLGREGCYIIFTAILVSTLLVFTDINIKIIIKRFFQFLAWSGTRFYMLLKKGWDMLTREREKKARPKLRIKETPEPRIRVAPTPPPSSVTVQESPKEKIKVHEPPKIQQVKIEPVRIGDYHIPPIDILASPSANSAQIDTSDLQQTAEVLQQTLQDFAVDAQVINVSRGPVITQYELLPAPGVKIQKIEILSKDIALALKVGGVRVVAPIPGKGTVGIEVPNKKTSTVTLKELLVTEEFRSSKKLIPIALGKDVSGAPIISDLSVMPHLLIAGTTGSGKSVCINSIILSILYRFSPRDARFILIDPKMVELPVYNGIPHLVAPVITDPKKASYGLGWAVTEMERRYKIFAKIGVRNLAQYNEKIHKSDPIQDDDGNVLDVLPYIIIVIDELADLMLIAAVEIENNIARLAQLSRAVGIHLVLATQRPSVDVITGVIKANFPSRISFQVSSKVDSRTVLDANGADILIGKGDMLFIPPGSSKLIRGQGAFVSDKEIHEVISFIKSQESEKIEYEAPFEKTSAKGSLGETQGDDLTEDAIEVIKQTAQASVSILQRRLRIGYTRAARIMDLLEEQGFVGPYNGSKARDILVDTYVD